MNSAHLITRFPAADAFHFARLYLHSGSRWLGPPFPRTAPSHWYESLAAYLLGSHLFDHLLLPLGIKGIKELSFQSPVRCRSKSATVVQDRHSVPRIGHEAHPYLRCDDPQAQRSPAIRLMFRLLGGGATFFRV